MGFPPPPDAPPLDAQAAAEALTAMPASPLPTELCGFKIPPKFKIPKQGIPAIPPFPNYALPPLFNFSLPLQCPALQPPSVESLFGGGRLPTGIAGLAAEQRDF